MADGVLYIARGDRYVEAAVQSARSVRSVTPALPLAIASDGPAPPEFDHAITLTEPDGYRAKIVGVIASPFDRTLMLDVDTYAAGDVSEVLSVLDTFDVAAAHAPNRVVFRLNDVPDSFPELNTGVIAVRRSDRAQRLLHSWLDEYDRMRPLDPRSKDQPSFRRALYFATDVRLAVLPPEFNLRFSKAGYYNQSVRILHGWAGTQEYGVVAALLNDRVKTRGHASVFIGQKLLNRQADVVGRFPDKPERWRRKARNQAND